LPATFLGFLQTVLLQPPEPGEDAVIEVLDDMKTIMRIFS